ncbi:MAG: deoxyribose-phosphate aldolase [Nanoarchaeota archaeon]
MIKELKNNPLMIAKYIDHTEVSPNSIVKEIKELCAEVNKYSFYSVMVLPYYAKLARKLTKSKVGVVIGFPFGVQSTKAKIDEIKEVYGYVDEFDVVINRAAFKNKDYNYVLKELKKIRKVIGRKIMKVIIESPELSNYEIKKASEIVLASGADFVKTAVGLRGDAQIKHIRIMKKVVKNKIKVKASGGIKTFEQALGFIRAGADRIGTSHGIEIVNGALGKKIKTRKRDYHE